MHEDQTIYALESFRDPQTIPQPPPSSSLSFELATNFSELPLLVFSRKTTLPLILSRYSDCHKHKRFYLYVGSSVAL